jgi:hypothetical protein
MTTPTDPPTDELIALLCADYLDHLNGSTGRTRAEIASIPLAEKTVLQTHVPRGR